MLVAIALFFNVGEIVCAQPEPLPVTDQDLAAHRLPQEGYSPIPGEDYSQPLPDYPDPVGEPPWCESPYQHSAVRIGIEFNPTTSKISDGGFGFWTDDSVLASRIVVGHENSDGVGWRVQFWDFHEKVGTPIHWIDTRASTLYVDADKRFCNDGAELTIGGGLAAGGWTLTMGISTINSLAGD